MTASDTIAAISTPPGEGAIALVRVSGANAIGVAGKIFRGKEKPSRFASHVQHFGEIFDGAHRLIDQVVLSVHRAPSSYTGEDLVEISCHGGTLVSAKVLEACLRAGARAARPGEFTERAFLNGKMDLTQAEAVIDLIRARTDLALRSATEQLEGRLGDQIRKLRDESIALLAHINASIDFPEEDIAPDEGERLRARLDSIREEIAALLATADQGRDLRENNDWKDFQALRISCLTGEGLPNLQTEILARIRQQNLRPESAVAINTRHRDCLRRALESCDRARAALREGLSPEYVAVDLDQALRALGEVIGLTDVEQILDSVFSQFCIGK